MLQSFLIGRLPVAMATVLKFRLHGFVRNVLIHHLPKYGYTSGSGIINMEPDRNKAYFFETS